ncbi:MAG: hypothetical protein C0606_07755 [Hyphomicrobiales bacterium]|nr:MAG: hypothetical protein C0606_07755 [Hyphomicrobiales bacterium]
MAVLEIRDLRKVFGTTEVLTDIDLTVEKGDFLVLVGPSGCGKSTLLNMIAGLESVTAGEIEINGRVVNDLSPKDRNIAMVFQSYALYPTMTVAKNITYGMRVRGVPKAERDAALNRVATQLQIDHLLDRKPSQLSGGQRQRVAMGRALVREPDIFLFDEPLSNLDAKLRVEMRAEIKRLHKRLEATIVYVTHDQIEAMSLATHVAVLNAGRIAQIGPPKTLYNTPNSVFVASFIGSPAMNFLAGTLEKAGDGWLFAAEKDDTVRLPVTDYAFIQPPQDGQEVLFGIRPEYISDRVDTDGEHIWPLTVTPLLVETNGFDQHVTFNFCGKDIEARLSPRTIAVPGETLDVQMDLSGISLFDAASELRL